MKRDDNNIYSVMMMNRHRILVSQDRVKPILNYSYVYLLIVLDHSCIEKPGPDG